MITQNDLLLYIKAQKALEQAQLMLQFASSHLSEVYSLGKEDTINFATGEITRASVEAE